MRFLSTFGRLPGTWSNLLLILASGLFEGIGLSLFIPLLHVMNNGGTVDLPRPFSSITVFLESFGFSPNAISILILIATLSLLALTLGYLQRKYLIKSKLLYTLSVRNDLFGGLVDSSWGYSSKRSHGELLNHMTTECARAGQALGFELMAVALFLQIMIYLAFSIAISWQLSIIVGGFGFIIFYAVRPFTRHGKQLGDRVTGANREFSFNVLEYLRSLKLLKATASEQLAKDGMSKWAGDIYRAGFVSELNLAKVSFVTQALPVLLLTVIIWVSFEVLNIQISLILVFLIFLVRLAPRVAQVQQQIQSYHLNSPAFKVVQNMIDASRAEREQVNNKGLAFERFDNSIVLDNVSYKYENDGIPALRDVSMTIGRNQMVAIVGSSGAGKSTLTDLLTNLRRPTKGRIIVDGIELGEIDLNSWRRRIGIVNQDTMIFNASLRDNLLFFKPDATDDDIDSALSLAHMDEVIADLPDGIDTVLGEGGVRFSGGQKQRIALARALIRKPDLLILDEATSALDSETERYIQDSLGALAHTITIVIIAHRLSTVRRADMIYVLENGQLVERGSLEELLEKGGRFAELRTLEFT